MWAKVFKLAKRIIKLLINASVDLGQVVIVKVKIHEYREWFLICSGFYNISSFPFNDCLSILKLYSSFTDSAHTTSSSSHTEDSPSLTLKKKVFSGSHPSKWKRSVEKRQLTDLSILPFHFLFGPLSIKQEIEENILHLAGSIEMGQALWTGETFWFLTHCSADLLNHTAYKQIFDLQLIY